MKTFGVEGIKEDALVYGMALLGMPHAFVVTLKNWPFIFPIEIAYCERSEQRSTFLCVSHRANRHAQEMLTSHNQDQIWSVWASKVVQCLTGIIYWFLVKHKTFDSEKVK